MLAPGERVLVREFVHRCLYSPGVGYFNRKHSQLIPDSPALDFKAMRGEADFRERLAAAYATDEGEWTTPVEVFQPYYARAICQWAVNNELYVEGGSAAAMERNGIHFYEIGGGNGTCARNILDFLQKAFPDVYERSTYTIVELSEALSQRQKRRIGKHPLRQQRMSILDWNETVPGRCYVVGLEVLDNMPHDKVLLGEDGGAQQVMVRADADGTLVEEPEPVSDPLLAEWLELYERLRLDEREDSYYSSHLGLSASLLYRAKRAIGRVRDRHSGIVYAPTTALAALKVIDKHFPQHHLLLADFNDLPDRMPGRNGPLVSSKERDHSTYLEAPGRADIFYPTDFGALSLLYGAITERPSEVLTNREFMQLYADVDATATRTGWNPLLDYYDLNTRLFVGGSG